MRVRSLERRLRGAKLLRPRAGDKRACVALLLRVAPQHAAAYADVLSAAGGEGDDGDALASALFAAVEVEHLELFFILRAANERDRWSGQVGLPGGRQEKGESDEATVAREVYEEVGLRVPGLADEFRAEEPACFVSVGRVHDRQILQGKHGLVVTAHVFLQTTEATPPLLLDPSEVGACGWCPLSLLLSDRCARPMTYDLGNGLLPTESPAIYRIAKFLALDKIVFTKVPLAIEPLYIASELDAQTGQALSTRERAVPQDVEMAVRDAFFLWGMTLGIVNDMLTDLGRVRPERITLVEKVSSDLVFDKVFESTSHNVLLGLMTGAYRRATGDPMPWNMYIRAYPVLVLILSSLPAIALGTSILSRL